MQKLSFVFCFLAILNLASGVDLFVKEIAVNDFNRVVLMGKAQVHIQQSDKESLRVSGSKRALEEVSASIKYGELVIAHVKKGWFGGFFHADEVPVYFLNVKDLNSVTLKGSGEILGDGVIKTGDLKLIVEGAGQMNFDLEAKEVKASIFGAGKIVLMGTADNQVVEIEGPGKYEGKDLLSKKGKLMINGSGEGDINAKDELDVTLNGSGHVNYFGNPKVVKHISGKGNVINK